MVSNSKKYTQFLKAARKNNDIRDVTRQLLVSHLDGLDTRIELLQARRDLMTEKARVQALKIYPHTTEEYREYIIKDTLGDEIEHHNDMIEKVRKERDEYYNHDMWDTVGGRP